MENNPTPGGVISPNTSTQDLGAQPMGMNSQQPSSPTKIAVQFGEPDDTAPDVTPESAPMEATNEPQPDMPASVPEPMIPTVAEPVTETPEPAIETAPETPAVNPEPSPEAVSTPEEPVAVPEVAPIPETPEVATEPVADPVPVEQTDTPAETAPSPAFMQDTPSPATPAHAEKVTKKHRSKATILLVALIAIVVIGGGSVAAYFGVMVPNKPENKMLSAMVDLVSQKSLTTEGIVDYTPLAGGTGLSFTYKSAANTETNQLSVSGTVGVKGTQFPYEMRYIDKNIYAKVGGLNKLADALPATAGATYKTVVDAVKKINDQWYVLDSSYLQSLGKETSCVTDIHFVLTDEDKTMLKTAYQNHPLFKVTNSISQQVNGVNTTKYTVDPSSDAEANAFATEIKNLSLIKKIKDCGGDMVNTKDITSKVDTVKSEAKGTIALYISDDKKLRKIEVLSQDKTAATKFTAVFTYGAVQVTKPDNAKPLQDLIGSVMSSYGLSQ